MKVNFELETPAFVAGAREAKKGLNWFLEAVVFVLMFFAVTIGEVLVMLPIELGIMYTDAGYMEAVASGDANAIVEAAARLASSDILTIASLFANIAMIGITMLFCKLLQKRKMNTLGFVKKDLVKEYGIGLAVGFGLFTAAVLICLALGTISLKASSNFTIGIFLLFAAGFMIQGMAEEVLCRSYLMVSIARRYPIWVAVIFNAVFFAILHLGNPGMGVLPFINLALFGVFASIYFIKRGSIWGIAAVHSVWNFVQGNFYGIKVSGMQISCSVFECGILDGEIVNGADFGLEGGLAVTVVLVAGILFLLTTQAKDVAPEAVKIDEAEAIEEIAEMAAAAEAETIAESGIG